MITVLIYIACIASFCFGGLVTHAISVWSERRSAIRILDVEEHRPYVYVKFMRGKSDRVYTYFFHMMWERKNDVYDYRKRSDVEEDWKIEERHLDVIDADTGNSVFKYGHHNLHFVQLVHCYKKRVDQINRLVEGESKQLEPKEDQRSGAHFCPRCRNLITTKTCYVCI